MDELVVVVAALRATRMLVVVERSAVVTSWMLLMGVASAVVAQLGLRVILVGVAPADGARGMLDMFV